MKIVKEAVYMSIFGASMCLASCGKDNKNETQTENMQDSINTPEKDGVDTEIDSLVSRDTVMPAL
jgi:hypothetical protein